MLTLPLSAKRGALVAGVVFVAMILNVGEVSAATVLEFKPVRGMAGQRVTGTTVGAGMQGIPSGRVVVLLAPSNRVADVAKGLNDPRLVRFGVMTADEKDVGHFIGTVPNVEAGSYIAVAYERCRECAQGGGVFTIGEFEVSGGALPRTGPAIGPWVLMGGAFLALGLFVVRFDNRRNEL